jgi:hypothetical protein
MASSSSRRRSIFASIKVGVESLHEIGRSRPFIDLLIREEEIILRKGLLAG